MSGRLSKFSTAKDMLNASAGSGGGGGSGDQLHWKVLVPFPSGDSVFFTDKHQTRLNFKSSTVPMDKELEVVGLAHSLRIGKGLQPPDRPSLTFSVEKVEADGSTTVVQGATIQPLSPLKPISLKYYRALTIKKTEKVRDCSCGPHHSEENPWQPPCWMDGTDERTKEVESFYAVIYDGYKAILVSPGLECVFVPREALEPKAGQLSARPAPLQRSLAMQPQHPTPPAAARKPRAHMSIPAAPAKLSAKRQANFAAAAAGPSRPKYLDPNDSDADIFEEDEDEEAAGTQDDTVLLEMTTNGLRKAPYKSAAAAHPAHNIH